MNFARSKPTEWTGNKRIHLPKSGSSSLEAYLEVRRKSASRIYDQCLALLGEGDDRKGYENLSSEEKIGLKSLQKRVSSGELVICQTDKSGKFAVLTREQYITAGSVHTSKDLEVSREVSENIERHLNGHMRWWAAMTNLSADWNQQARAVRNLLNHGLAVCPMTLLIKDHKHFEIGETPPSRSVMAGNVGGGKEQTSQ